MRWVALALARGVTTLAVALVLCWACVEAAPGDVRERAARVAGMLPAEGERAWAEARARVIDAAAEARGVAATPAGRLARLAGGALRGDLGRAWVDGRPVSAHLGAALPTTLALVGASLAIAWALGLLGAVLAARRPGGAADGAVAALAAVGLALPLAWVAVIALRTLAWGSPWRWFAARGSFGLAAACLGLQAAALVARQGRAALASARAEAFVAAARARGASPMRALVVHALAASGATLVALLPILTIYAVGASPVVERAFDLPGLGAMLLDASAAGDAPRLVGGVLAAAVIVMIASAASGLLRRRLDPRLP